jgi:hypothetical protein
MMSRGVSVSGAHEPERKALDAVLDSGIFERSPALANFLSYVCRMHFEGRAGELKEYTIAVEALNRAPDFDHTRDSIVRLQAHRLRKRLAEFYSNEGADLDLKITFKPGSYAPVFVRTGEDIEVAEPVPPEGVPAPPREQPPGPDPAEAGHKHARRRWVLAASTLALAAAILWPILRPKLDAARTVAPAGTELRISAGASEPLVDRHGRTWLGDRYFSRGEAVQLAASAQTSGDRPYDSYRTGTFTYRIPVEPGSYEVHLHFPPAPNPPPEGGFDVHINGVRVLQAFNVASATGGPGMPLERVFAGVTVGETGMLDIELTGGATPAALAGIEMLPQASGTVRPVRILAGRTQPYLDPSGVLWEGDRYYRGGTAVARFRTIPGASDPNLFAGERYGDFQYAIPVAEGSYRVVLRFTEGWYGTQAAPPGRGRRVFDVILNGRTLLDDFDILAETTDSDRPLVKTFHGVRPNASGMIHMEFKPTKNNATICAIEIVSEKSSSADTGSVH